MAIIRKTACICLIAAWAGLVQAPPANGETIEYPWKTGIGAGYLSVSMAKDKLFDDASGVDLRLTRTRLGKYQFELWVGHFELDAKTDFLDEGSLVALPIVLGVRRQWRADKKIVPHAGVGLGAYNVFHYRPSQRAREMAANNDEDREFEIVNSLGIHLGGGAAWFPTQRRDIALFVDVKFFSSEFEVEKTVRRRSTGEQLFKSKKKVDMGGTATSAGLAIYFN